MAQPRRQQRLARVLLAALLVVAPALASVTDAAPSPPVWPELFSAVLLQNRSGALAQTELWYDLKRGANLNVIRPQLGGGPAAAGPEGGALGGGGATFDLELDSGESFVWRTAAPPGQHSAAGAGARVVSCRRLRFDVGILRPNWLADATHLGRTGVDGPFLADVYEKAGFIRYYAEAEDGKGEEPAGGGGADGAKTAAAAAAPTTPQEYRRRPVRWTFLESGADFHVLEFAAGKDARPVPAGAWRPPKECFADPPPGGAAEALPANAGRIWRGALAPAAAAATAAAAAAAAAAATAVV